MGWKTFSPEELVEIRRNPYVKSATPYMIRFTVESKLDFWHEYHEKGHTGKDIIYKMGFDPEIIGESRLRGIVHLLSGDESLHIGIHFIQRN